MDRKNLRRKVGKGIRQLRCSYSWTQAELAKRSKVSRRYIQKIESMNPPDMTIDVLVKIANAFGITCSNILRRKKSK
ncbi:MAG: helix-turn-helix domain-containing protein [Candidatus Omnitrophica bacterium]|nr:helix-turn-helix domain-containing protein [Candidatus Omnitrophota bacterium]